MMNLKQLAIAVVLGTAGLSVGPHAQALEVVVSPALVFGMSLGAQLADSTAPGAPLGAEVSSTTPLGPFDHAGIQPGDVIISVNGTTCTDSASCLAQIDNPPAGTKILLQVWDHNTPHGVSSIWVTLG